MSMSQRQSNKTPISLSFMVSRPEQENQIYLLASKLQVLASVVHDEPSSVAVIISFRWSSDNDTGSKKELAKVLHETIQDDLMTRNFNQP